MAAAEDARWTDLLSALEALTPEQLEVPGYYPEGWSVKDLMAHICSWQAEAAQVLEQIRYGTFDGSPRNVEELNRQFFEANHDLPLAIVRAELWASRTRMLTEFNAVPELTREAEEWFRESGREHYDEHLPRLLEWSDELRTQ